MYHDMHSLVFHLFLTTRKLKVYSYSILIHSYVWSINIDIYLTNILHSRWGSLISPICLEDHLTRLQTSPVPALYIYIYISVWHGRLVFLVFTQPVDRHLFRTFNCSDVMINLVFFGIIELIIAKKKKKSVQ